MGRVAREIPYALRRLLSSGWFTVAAMATLSLSIGATTSVFSIADGVLLKAFPYADADRILTIWESNRERHLPKFTVSPADLVDFRTQSRSFSAIAASQHVSFVRTGSGEPERLAALAVTPDYFSALGIVPMIGRALASDSSGPPEVVLGYGYWRRHGAVASVVDETIVLDNHQYQVVGVLPEGLPGDDDLWTRLSLSPDMMSRRDIHFLTVYGRVKSGVAVDAAQRDLAMIGRRLARQYPESNENWSVTTVPLLTEIIGPVKPTLVALLLAAGLVLAIGVANLSNLFLVRFLARDRDLAVRVALGATRGIIATELLVEAALIGLTAGAVGGGLALGGVRVLRTLAPLSYPRVADAGIDGRALAFCALVSIAATLVFGALAAWQASRASPADALREGPRGTTSARRRRLQDALVVMQVALTCVLVIGAGLAGKALANFQQRDTGFRPQGVLTAEVSLSGQRYEKPGQVTAFVSDVAPRVAAIRGIEAAAVSSMVPGSAALRTAFDVVGGPRSDPNNAPIARPAFVSEDYFRVMGIAVNKGRVFQSSDNAGSRKVAVIDDLLERREFSNVRTAIGSRLALFSGPIADTVEVVGVVANVRQGGLVADDVPWMYLALAQYPTPSRVAYVLARTSHDPASQARPLRMAIASVDGAIPVANTQTMSARIAQTVGPTRFLTFLAALFALVALSLSVVGIFGVLAYIVDQRKRETCIRVALGSTRSRVVASILGRALVLTTAGLALGSMAAWQLTNQLATLVVPVSPHDVGVFAGSAASLMLVALAAGAVPALRAARANPAAALNAP